MAKRKTSPPAGEVKPTVAEPEVKTVEKPDLVPLTAEQRATLTLCANRYGMEHAIASAAAVEYFIRNPDALEKFAAEADIDVDQLPKLLEPFPDAATLKVTNDKPVE